MKNKKRVAPFGVIVVGSANNVANFDRV